MRRLMAEEGELGEDHPEGTGHQQLQPGVTEQDHAGAHPGEGKHERAEDQEVEAAATPLQTFLADAGASAVKVWVSGFPASRAVARAVA